MKTTDIRLTLKIAGLLMLAGTVAVQAQNTYIKQANATAIDLSGSWSSGGPPGAGDIGEWNNVATATGDTITSVGGAYSMGEIQIANNVAGAVSVTDGTTGDILTLKGATSTGVGIDMSAANQNLTLGVPLTLGGNQTWKIVSGKQLNYTGVNWLVMGANVVTLTGGGTFFYEPTTPFTTGPSSSAGAGIVINGSTLNVEIMRTASSSVANYLGANTALTMTPSTAAFSIYQLGEAGTSGNHTETFTSLTLNPGSSVFGTYVGRGASSGNCVGFVVIHRNGGAIADFANNGGNAWGGSANDYGLPEPAAGTVSMGYATGSANDWASPRGDNTDMTIATYVNDTFTTATADVNETLSDSPAAFTINSLRFNTAAANTLTLTGANTITSGGILFGSTVAANNTTIAGGTLTSGNANADSTSDLIVINNTASTGNINIYSTLVNNGATAVGLTVGTTSTTTPLGFISLSAANTFSGTTTITKGTLMLSNSLALQDSTLNYSFPGTINFGPLTAATLAGLSGTVSLALPASFALTVGNNNANSAYSGAFSGVGATLTKTGTGTFTLNGNNLNTGNTTVSGGTLALGASGAFGGAASLASSATLDVSAAGNYSLGKTVSGTGTINGGLTLASGGVLNPTGSTGALTLNNNLTLNGGTVAVSVNAATPANGIIIVGASGSGNLTNMSGTIQLSITGTLANGTYKIIGVPNGTIVGSGSLLSVSGFSQLGQAAMMVANPNELDLVVSTYISQNLVWVGDGSANLWNVNSAANWNDTGPTPADPSVFHNNDYTILDNTSANPTVNLSGTLSPATVTVNGTQNYTLTSTGSIGGSATLTNNNSGILTVLTTNTYTGGTVINSGTIQVGNGTTAGGEIGTGPVTDNGTLDFDLPAGSQTVSAVSGTGVISNSGPGTIVLNGADTVAGGTTIGSGTLKQGAVNVLPNGGGVGDTTVNGTLDTGGQNGAVNGLFGTGTVNNSGGPAVTLTAYGSSSVNPSVFGGVIENTGGALTFNFNGSGNELELTNNNTYTGGTIVTAGTLQLGNANGIAGGTLNVVTGATLDLNGFGPTIDSVTGGGTIDNVSAGGTITLTIGNNGGSGTFPGVIQDSTGTINLVKNGAGTETLTGDNAYAGTTTVNGGTLAVAVNGVIQGTTLGGSGFLVNGGSLTSSGSSTFGDGIAFLETSGTVNVGTLNTANDANGSSTIEITGGSFSATAINMPRDIDYATAPTAAAPIVANQANGFYVDGSTANVSLGTLSIGTVNSSASARLDAGTINMSGEVLVSHSTTGGRWSILQVNGGIFTDPDTANGIVIAPNSGAAADDAEVYLSGGVTSAGLINFGLASDTVAGGAGWLFVNGGASLYIGSGGIVKLDTVGYTATIELTSGILGATANWSSSLPMNLNGTGFTIQTADTMGNPWDITLGGVLSETASSSLTVDGGGILTLSGANQYNSGTIVSNATLNINGINALGGGNYHGLMLTNNSTLQYAAAFSGNGSGDVSVSPGLTLGVGSEIIDVNGNSVTYASTIGNSGTGSLTVASTIPGGVLTLQGANTYSGSTTVSGGTLNLSGSISSATVTVASGGTLSGTGTASGSVEIQYAGVLAPGGSVVGTNTVGALQLDSGSTNNFAFNGSANDQTTVANSGGFVINDGSDTAVFNLYTVGGVTPWTTAGTYNLIKYTGTAPTLDSTWTTSSATNPHIANPQLNCLYAFGLSGGYLTVAITLNSSAVAGIWTNNVNGNWSGGVNWSSNPKVPHAAGDTATFGNSTAFRTVTLDANESVGTVTFNNANSFDIASAGNVLTLDGTGVGASVYVLGGTANTIQTKVALNDNVAVNVGSGNSLAVSGIITNAPGATENLAVTGSGTLVMSGNNGYGPAPSSGFGTTVNGPVLQVGNNNALAAGDVSIAGSSTLQAGTSVNIPNNIDVAPSVTVTVNNNGNNFTLGGTISDSGSLTEVGTGTLVLNGNNIYSGNTTVNAGVLSISQAANVQNSPNIILNGGDLLGTGTFAASPNIGIGPASGSIPGTALIDAASGQQFQVSGIISSAGNTGTNNLVVNSGAGNNGMVILSGNNTFRGTTVISNGLVDVQGTLSLQDSTVNYNNQGGALVIDGSIGAITLGGLTGTQNLALTNLSSAGATVTVGNNNLSTTYSGDFNDAALGGALTKAGQGSLTLTGTNNTYNGTTTVSAGVLQLNTNGVMDCGAITLPNSSGAEMIVNGGTLVATNGSAVNAGTAAIGLLVSSGSATFLGALNEQNNSDLNDLIETTGGSLTAASMALGRSGVSDTAQPTAGSTADGLYVDGGTVNILGNLDMSSSAQNNSSVSARIDAGSLTVGGEVIIGLNNGGRWSVMDVNGGVMTVTNAVTGINVGGPDAGDAELLVRAGTLNAGLIGLGNGAVADTVVLNQTGGSIYVGGGGIVQVSPAATASITLGGGLLGASAAWVNTNAVTLTGSEIIQAGDASGNPWAISLAGPINGSGPLISSGSGTNTVSVANTYTSPTIVSNGTLALIPSGSIATSSQVAIGAGATFDMSALGGYAFTASQALAGNSTNGAGHIAAGGNTVTLNSGSPVLLQAAGSPGGSIGKISVAGTLALNANTITINANGSPIGAGSYRLLDCTGTLTGTANTTPVFTGAGSTGGAASISTTAGVAGHVDLTVAKATPVVQTLPTASNITNGNPLSVSVLSGGSVTNTSGTNVPGIFAFTSPSTVPPVGTANQSVTFTPTDTADYNSTTMNVSVTVINPVNIGPTNILAVVSGSTLTLSWPADHTGWRLLVQTNTLASGLNPATNAWFTVPGSASVNLVNITLNPTNGAVFYRMVYP